MKIRRKIIKIDESLCNGCGLCVTDCHEGAIKVVDGKARLVNESFCDGLGACIGSCPTNALKIIESEVEVFDAAAAKNHGELPIPSKKPQASPCSCPGSAPRIFENVNQTDEKDTCSQSQSELRQWPIQLRLLPTTGPLFANRDLLLLADCVAVSYPDLHRSLLRNRTVIMSCPKLDNNRESVEKLAQIFKNSIRSITIAIIEVPCCNGLVQIVREALALSGVSIATEVIRIGIKGELVERFGL